MIVYVTYIHPTPVVVEGALYHIVWYGMVGRCAGVQGLGGPYHWGGGTVIPDLETTYVYTLEASCKIKPYKKGEETAARNTFGACQLSVLRWLSKLLRLAKWSRLSKVLTVPFSIQHQQPGCDLRSSTKALRKLLESALTALSVGPRSVDLRHEHRITYIDVLG